VRGSNVYAEFSIPFDELKQQVAKRDFRNYIVEHLPILLHGNYSGIAFLEKPRIFVLNFMLESRLAAIKRPIV